MNDVIDLSNQSSQSTDIDYFDEFFDQDDDAFDRAAIAACTLAETNSLAQKMARSAQETAQTKQREATLSDMRNNLITQHHLRPQLIHSLFDHQVEGVYLGINKFRGRLLLCDEMGLGKTHQALCIASKYLNEQSSSGGGGTCLILCPASLRVQWAKHVEQLLPEISPLSIRCVEKSSDSLISLLQDTVTRIIICSHALSRALSDKDVDIPNGSLGVIIIDECHVMRSGYAGGRKNALQATSMCRAVIHSKYVYIVYSFFSLLLLNIVFSIVC